MSFVSFASRMLPLFSVEDILALGFSTCGLASRLALSFCPEAPDSALFSLEAVLLGGTTCPTPLKALGTTIFSANPKSSLIFPLLSSAGQGTVLSGTLTSWQRLSHCMNSRLSWYLALESFSTSMQRLMPNLSKAAWSTLKLFRNSQSFFAFQFTLFSATLPGQIASRIWQQTAPEPSSSILVRLIWVRAGVL